MDNICYGPIVKLVFVALYCKRAGRWREGWEGPPAERKQRRRDRPRAAFASHTVHSAIDLVGRPTQLIYISDIYLLMINTEIQI